MKTLEDTLREIAPTPDPDFVADMERRMQLGFPPKKPPRLARPTITLPRFGRPAFAGAAASAMLALVVSLAIVTDGDDPQPDAPVAFEAQGGGGAVAPDAVAPTTARDSDSGGGSRRAGNDVRALSTEAAPDIAPRPIPPPGNVAPNRRARKVEQAAQLTLAAGTDEFDQIADSVFAIAARRNGFVLQSSFTETDEGTSSGYFDLRVPAAQLQQTLNELSGVATVRSRSESASDVTGAFVSVRDRLRTARAEQKSLLVRLEHALTEEAASAIRRRLGIVGRRIGGLRSQLRNLRERTGFATVSVQLVDEASGSEAAGSETDEAFDDAVASLEDILTFLIRALGVAVPVALAGFLGWLAVSRSRGRARERTLA